MMSFMMTRWSVVPAGARSAPPVDRTSVRLRAGTPRSGTGPEEATPRPAEHAAGGEDGCGPRPGPRRDRSRTPPSVTTRSDRERRNTTADRSACAFPPDGGGRTRRARGSGRSSGQTGAALGAARLDDGPSTTGAHPRAKAVLAGSTAVVGLKGTLHGDLRTFGTKSHARREVTTMTCEGYGAPARTPNQGRQTTDM